jgi:diguanylate cyclase (GGDEF)-like protein
MEYDKTIQLCARKALMVRLFAAQREFGVQLGTDGNQTVLSDIERTNWLRLRIFFVLTMIYEILLILAVDFPALATAGRGSGSPPGAGEPSAIPLAFMVCHGGIFLFSGLAIADLDHFKILNDKHGHPAGDAALRSVGMALGKAIRSTDALARWGGEEFILLIGGCDEEGVLAILERARSMVQACCIEVEHVTISCTMSIGYAEIDISEDDPFTRAYNRADAALYQAKERGRDRVAGSREE